MVVTRSFEEGVRSGRNRCLNAISEALSAAFELNTFRLHNLLETRNVLDVLGALARALWALVRFRPLALQCLLYAHGRSRQVDIKRSTSTRYGVRRCCRLCARACRMRASWWTSTT